MNTGFQLILGDKNSSSWSLRAWLMLKHLGIEFEERTIQLYTAQTQAELFPAAKLWPEDPAIRTYARNISNEMHAGFNNLRQLMPFTLSQSQPLPSSPALTQDIQRIEAIWQECRTKYSSAGQYLFGEFSIADAMYAPIVLRFRTYGYNSPNSAVRDYCTTILGNPFIQEWLQAATNKA